MEENNAVLGTVSKATFSANSFVERQVEGSGLSYYGAGTIQDVVELGARFFGDAVVEDGIAKVSVPAQGFLTGVVQLKKGDKLTGEFKSRHGSETPRKEVRAADGKLMLAVSVELIFYSHETLTKTNHATTDSDWELVSINASPTLEPTPIHPQTLIANYYGLDGGTPMDISYEEFVEMLEFSVLFWNDKAMAAAG